MIEKQRSGGFSSKTAAFSTRSKFKELTIFNIKKEETDSRRNVERKHLNVLKTTEFKDRETSVHI